MNSSDFQMTSKQLGFMIMGTLVGVNFLTIPRTASAWARQDAWMAVFIGALLPLLVLLLVDRLGRRFPGMDFVQVSQALFGKVAGSLLVITLSLHMILHIAKATARFASFDSTYLLPRTPVWAISLLILMVSLYVAGKGAKVTARINELLFYLYVPLLFLAIQPLVTGADYTYLLPVGGSGIAGIARSSWDVSLYYGRLEFLMVACFMVARKDEVLEAGMMALAAVVIPYAVFTIACLGVFGPGNLQELAAPVFSMFKAVRYPVLERMELLFMFTWSIAFRPVFNLLCMSGFALTRLLDLQERRHYLKVLMLIGAVAYILCLIPRNAVDIILCSDWLGLTYPVVGLGYPLLYLLAAVIRNGEVHHV